MNRMSYKPGVEALEGRCLMTGQLLASSMPMLSAPSTTAAHSGTLLPGQPGPVAGQQQFLGGQIAIIAILIG